MKNIKTENILLKTDMTILLNIKMNIF